MRVEGGMGRSCAAKLQCLCDTQSPLTGRCTLQQDLSLALSCLYGFGGRAETRMHRVVRSLTCLSASRPENKRCGERTFIARAQWASYEAEKFGSRLTASPISLVVSDG